MPWLDDSAPEPPRDLTAQTLATRAVRLNWKAPVFSEDGDSASGYVIYRFNEGEEINIQNAMNILKISFDKKLTTFTDTKTMPRTRYVYVVTALDRLKNESVPSNQVRP
jgi:hypothetical protein